MHGFPAEQSELPEGLKLLDRYTIIDRIAGGGMATIYRATDERLDRVVCVKLLRLVVEGSGSTSGGSVYQASYKHFLKEALALSKLQHPNTLRIYDFGYLEEGGRPFQISEFLDGGDLQQQVRLRGALKRDEALAILERVCGAVAEAHEHGIIHRDIKPSNIIFSRVGDALMPKLADFGIARSELRKRPPPGEPEETAEIVSTIPLFSPRWAAPEQLAGTEEGASTDVYALALVAAYMLAGAPLFDAEDVRSTFADRALGDTYASACLVAHGFPRELRDVLMSALRANPAERMASPLSFYEALSHALGGSRMSLPPPVMAPRSAMQSVTLEAETSDGDAVSARGEERARRSVVPQERTLDVGGRRVRVVDVHEKLDLTVSSGAPNAIDVRFRITLLPGRGQSMRMHLKGLNCFVAKTGGSASPALVADTDGAAELVSMTRQRIGRVSWSFGALSQPGGERAFRIGDSELVIPSPQGLSALALEAGEGPEVIVICRRR